MSWGGEIVGIFALELPPFRVADARLIRLPGDEGFIVAFGGQAGNSRLIWTDDETAAAVAARARAEYIAIMERPRATRRFTPTALGRPGERREGARSPDGRPHHPTARRDDARSHRRNDT